MSNVQQHDVDEAELTDAEELLERDKELARATISRAPSPSKTRPDADSVYEGDIEDAGERRHARIARHRSRIVQRGLAQMRVIPIARTSPQL